MSTFETLGMDTSASLLQFPIQVYATATTDSSGNFSISYSDISLTHVYSAYAMAISPDNTVANTCTAAISSLSLTAVSGHVIKPQTVGALGGSPVQSAGSGISVRVIVYGDQN